MYNVLVLKSEVIANHINVINYYSAKPIIHLDSIVRASKNLLSEKRWQVFYFRSNFQLTDPLIIMYYQILSGVTRATYF